MKDKTISEMLDDLKETIKQHSQALWEWEGCEGYCDLLNDLVPMVDEIQEKYNSTKLKKRQQEQTAFFTKYFSDNVEVGIVPNYDEIFEWLSMIPEGTIISRKGGVGMNASTLKDIIKNGKAYYIVESELKEKL